ncbi:type VII secretion target [Catenuloplanes sp. NPDC051500]|uniref:type VII secretion target n=1 Tax=Catenuloplanes sp. NPDC051500 TaxID=3363959 RepID=UPI0037A67E9A
MAEGFEVDIEALRAHATAMSAIHDRFAAIKAASGTIFQADDAYGQLCQFLPPVLEGRHRDQDTGVDMLAENIDLLAAGIRKNADAYQRTEESTTGDFDSFRSAI